jgi:asparagine synthase (glutamine-hydrolysing)
VVASVAAQGAAHIKTFNINLAEKEFAEGDKARRMAAHLGAEHHEIMLREDELLAGLPGALAAMDQPTVNGINTYFVSAATKQAGVTVALSGLGGDELFAGYRSFRLVPRLERLATWSPAWTRQLAASLLDSRFCPVPHDPRVLAWLRGEDGYAHPFYLSRLLLAPAQVAQLLQPDWLLAIDFGTYAEEFADRRALLERHDAVNRVSCLELSVYLRNTLLRDTDCMSMAHSLEVRVPLIDHLLTEQVLRLPGAWKLDGARRKPLLLAALDRPLPEEIERQPKHGFELPWARWLRARLRDEVEQTLAEPGSLLGSALRWNGVRRLWQEFLEDRVHWSRPWLFYVLQKWSQQHLAQ